MKFLILAISIAIASTASADVLCAPKSVKVAKNGEDSKIN